MQLVVMTVALEVIYGVLPVSRQNVLVLTRETLVDLSRSKNGVNKSCNSTQLQAGRARTFAHGPV